MRLLIAALMGCAAGLATLSDTADAQGRDGQACFYQAPGYAGQRFCVDAGREAPRLPPGWDDRISSIEIDRGVEVEICDSRNFRGRCLKLSDSVPALGRRGNNRISSLRVDRRVRRPLTMVCFYDRPDFRGRQFCAEPGDLGNRLPRGWDDRISSIQLQGGASVEVCARPSLEGRCRTFDQDVAMLGRGLNDRISSYRVDDDARRPRDRRRRDERVDGSRASDGRSGPPPRAGEDEPDGRDGGRGGRDAAPGGRDRRGDDDLAGRGRGQGAPDGRDRRGGDDRADAPSAPPAPDRVCFFEHRDHGGRELCVNAGENLQRLPRGFDNEISSMRNWGRAITQVCDQPGFRGECRTYDSSDNYVGDHWNDRYSSIRVWRK